MNICRALQVCTLALTALLPDGVLASQPNIVFFLADDLGWSDVGYHGAEIETPHIDRLAASGVRLESFYVQPVCSPTRAALMTGRYPCRYGLQVGVIRPWADYGLPLDETLLPHFLREAGYSTAICGKWHLGLSQRAYLPTCRGFDHQYGHYCGAIDYFTHERDGGFDWHRNDQVCRDEGYTTVLLGDESVRLIQQHDFARPLFLYLPFNAPHTPLQALPEHLERYPHIKNQKRRAYAAMVHCMDEQIGRVAAMIEHCGQTANTLFIFCSDNGGPTQLGASNGNLRGGKGTLYEGGTRVVSWASWPSQIPAGTVCNEPMHMVDWYPTLLALAGKPSTNPLPLDGHNIWPTLLATSPTPHAEILLNVTPNNGAIRAGNWKLVRTESDSPARRQGRAKEDSAPALELFDVVQDAAEEHDRAADHPDIVRRLADRLDAYAKDSAPPRDAPKPKGFKAPRVWGEPE
ncbi:MAG: arylsulfatase [Planctomycetota bacterium]|nr:arylsulfatase [Planctomycetota bacterium]